MHLLSIIILSTTFFLPGIYALPVGLYERTLVPRTMNDGEGIFKACPSIDDLTKYIKHKHGADTIDNVVYWSFPGNGIQTKMDSHKVNGKSMYDFITQLDIDDWVKLYCTGEGITAKDVWNRASYALAMMSHGTAFIATGTGKDAPQEKSVWKTIEEPILKAHGKVTSIVRLELDSKGYKPAEELWKSSGKPEGAMPPKPR